MLFRSAWLRFAWGRYQTSDDGLPRPLLLGLLVLLFAILAWRILRGASRNSSRVGSGNSVRSGPGIDSAFYRIEKMMAEHGYGRALSEPVYAWIERLSRATLAPECVAELYEITQLHYRLRFDPNPMDLSARSRLGALVEAWLSVWPPLLKAKDKTS